MKKTIYHCSSKIIEKPMFGVGKKQNDYGLGFYCTQELDLAKEWGVSKDCDGFVNIYTIENSELSVLDLTSSNFSILRWLSILLENRTCS